MSYQPETDEVLTGSLNLLPSSSQIPREDAIALHNWRVDKSGALRSRLDDAVFATLASATNIHSIHTRLGSSPTRYYGADDDLFRNTTSVHSGFDGKPLGLASMYGFTYIMNQSAQGRDDGTTYGTWGLAAVVSAPTITPTAGGGGLLIGLEYLYYVTGVNAYGEETNPSPSAAFNPTNPNQIADVAAPSFAAGITHWNIYRSGNTLARAYRLNDEPMLVATTNFIDDGLNTLDDGLITEAPGLAMETDNDAPPACRGLVGPYYDQLLAYNSAAHSNWIYWSRRSKPYAWPGSALDSGNHTPVGQEGEAIIRVMLHPRAARIYKSKTIWRMSGDPDSDSSTLDVTNEDMGLIGEKAIDSFGDLDYFQADEGIYASNGIAVRKISGKLDPLFKGDPINLSGSACTPMDRTLAKRVENVLAICNGRLYFSYWDTNSNKSTLVYDIERDGWRTDSRGFASLYYEGQGYNFLGALKGDDDVLQLEQPQTHAFLTGYQSGYRDQGKRDHQKTYADLTVEYEVTLGADVSVDARVLYDEGNIVENLGGFLIRTTPAPDSKRARKVFRLGGGDGQMARTASVGITGTVSIPVQIYSMTLHYYLEARDALTFDSDETHLGYQGVKQIDMIELDVDASGNVEWDLLTDKPGGVMTSRDTGTVTTSGRQAVQIPLDPDALPEGRLVRLLLNATATFRLYGARIRYRQVGVWLDGAQGETFSTLEMAA